MKTVDEGIWFLYIASPIVEEQGLGVAPIARCKDRSIRLQGIPLSLSDIKLIGRESTRSPETFSPVLNRFARKSRCGADLEVNVTRA